MQHFLDETLMDPDCPIHHAQLDGQDVPLGDLKHLGPKTFL